MTPDSETHPPVLRLAPNSELPGYPQSIPLLPIYKEGDDTTRQATGWRILPETAEQVAEVLHWADSQKLPLAFSDEDARDLAPALRLDLSRLNRARKYRVADLTLTVEAGITMKQLAELTRPHGQGLPLSYPEQRLLAEAIAGDMPALETGFSGYPRDYVLGMEIAAPDGSLTHCGAEVVKNVTGYDLNKLYTGSHNTLGVVTAVTLKLLPAPANLRGWLFEFEDINSAFHSIDRLMKQNLPLSWCELYHRDRLTRNQLQKAIAPWQLLVEAGGDPELMKHVAAGIRELVSQPESESHLHPARKSVLFQCLSGWPADSLVAEIAFPKNRHTEFYYRLSLMRKTDLTPILQIRPAAGLAYLIWPGEQLGRSEDIDATLSGVREKAEALEGFLQLVHLPQAYRHLADRYNLPANPVARQLMQRLKQGYDPNGILYSRRLPLMTTETPQR